MDRRENLFREIEKLHARRELSQTVTPEYFEPGMMEYLDRSDGVYDAEKGRAVLRFEVKGTRYEGRTEYIEKMKCGDPVTVLRDWENPYNANNFTVLDRKGNNVGNLPAELCNALAPLYDEGELTVTAAFASFVEPITKRSRHARQAILFVEMHCELLTNDLRIQKPWKAEYRG